jgi:hypothetical protein
MNVQVTVNFPVGERIERYGNVVSIDTLMSALRVVYPTATSFVFVVTKT